MKANEMNMVAANNTVVKEDKAMTVKELREMAKAAGIKGYSKMNKTQLLDALAPKAEPEVELTQEEMEALNAPLPVAPVPVTEVSVGDLPITYDNAPANAQVKAAPTVEELIGKYTSDEFFNGLFYGCKVNGKFRGGIQFSIVKNNEDVEKKNAEGQRLSYNFISEYVLRRIIVEHITGQDYLDENGQHRLYNSGQIAIFNAVLESVYGRIALVVINENDANGNPTGRRTGCFINAKTVQMVYSGKFARGVKYFFYFKDAAGNTIKDAAGKTMCKCYVVRNSVLYTKNERGNKVSYELNDDGFAKLDQQCIFGGLMPTEEKKDDKPVAPANNGQVSPF